MGRLYFYIAIIIVTAVGFLLGYFTKFTGYDVGQTGNFTAYVISGVACTFSNDALNITFGDSIEAGSAYNATKNFVGNRDYSYYNVTADSANTVDMNITIRGLHFLSGNKVVGIGNVSWSSNTTDANSTNMKFPGTATISISYDTTNPVTSNAAAGSTAW